MKIVEKAIYELINNLADTYALRAPQNKTGSFIIMQRSTSERWRSINAPSGVAQVTLQVDAYADDYYTAKNLGASIEQTLDGYSGDVTISGTSPQEIIKINGISLQNDIDLIEQTDEPFSYRNLLSFLITYEQ